MKNIVLLFVAIICTQISFGQTSTQPFATNDFLFVNTNFSAADTADLDGDGKVDAVTFPVVTVGNYSPSLATVSVQRNTSSLGLISFTASSFTVSTGNGIYSSQSSWGYYGLNQLVPIAIKCADLNNDGKPEIVVLNKYYGVSVLQNTSIPGTISFSSPIYYTVGASSFSQSSGGENRSFDIADMNNDGKRDIIVTGYNRTIFSNNDFGFIAYLFNSGTGNSLSLLNNSTTPSMLFPVFNYTNGESSVLHRPEKILTLDYNNDGKLDIAVVEMDLAVAGAYLRIFINDQTTVVNGVEKILYQRTDNLWNSYDLMASDLNSDGVIELLKKQTTSGNVFAQNKNGSFTISPFLQGLTENSEVEYADLNADNKKECIYLQNDLKIFKNTQNNSGNSSPSYTTATSFTANGIGKIFVCDLDKDGKKEIMTRFGYLRNRIGEPIINSFSPTSGGIGTLVTINGRNFSAATSVKLGGVSVNFAIINDTTIRATASTCASGTVSVTNASGTATLTGFNGGFSANANIGPITGPVNVCSPQTATYSVSNNLGASSYTWTLPSGWTGSSNTHFITVTTGNSSGSISVVANNPCASSSPSVLAVTSQLKVLSTPTSINGESVICIGNSYTYTTPAITGATSYTWTLPSGWTGSSTTNSITVTPGSSGGIISVRAANSCTTSMSRTRSITVTSPSIIAPPSFINFVNEICEDSSFVFVVDKTPGTTSYTWQLPVGWTGNSTNDTMVVTARGNSGEIKVVSKGNCERSDTAYLYVNLVKKPGIIQSISGSSIVCPNSVVRYQVDDLENIANYVWSLPAGWTGTSNTNTIDVTVGNSSGIISVYAINTCGIESSVATKQVNVGGEVTAQIYSQNQFVTCFNTPINFTATSNVSGNASDWNDNAVLYTWKVYNGSDSIIYPARNLYDAGNTFTYDRSTIYLPYSGVSAYDSVICVIQSNMSCLTNNPANSNGIVVQVNPLPFPALSNYQSDGECLGQSLKPSDSSHLVTQVKWYKKKNTCTSCSPSAQTISGDSLAYTYTKTITAGTFPQKIVASGVGSATSTTPFYLEYGQSIFLDNNQNVYVIDYNYGASNSRILKFEPGIDSGITVVSGNGNLNYQHRPRALFVNGNDIYTVSGYNVLKWDQENQTATLINNLYQSVENPIIPNYTSTLNYTGISYSNGYVYAADLNLGVVMRWPSNASDADGEPVAYFAPSNYGNSHASIYVTGGNKLYVSLPHEEKIQRFNLPIVSMPLTDSFGTTVHYKRRDQLSSYSSAFDFFNMTVDEITNELVIVESLGVLRKSLLDGSQKFYPFLERPVSDNSFSRPYLNRIVPGKNNMIYAHMNVPYSVVFRLTLDSTSFMPITSGSYYAEISNEYGCKAYTGTYNVIDTVAKVQISLNNPSYSSWNGAYGTDIGNKQIKVCQSGALWMSTVNRVNSEYASFQWYKNNDPIAGATDSILYFFPVASNQDNSNHSADSLYDGDIVYCKMNSFISCVTNPVVYSDSFSIVVARKTYAQVDTVVCTPLPFVYYNNTFYQSGTYNVIIPNALGCDSLVTLNLTSNASFVQISDTIEYYHLPYVWNDTTITAAEYYQVPYFSYSNSYFYNFNIYESYTSNFYEYKTFKSTGCDSIIQLTLTVVPPRRSSVTGNTICLNSLPYTWNGNIIDTNASKFNYTNTTSLSNGKIVKKRSMTNFTIKDTLVSMGTPKYGGVVGVGIDSIVTFTLPVIRTDSTTIKDTVSQSYTLPWGGLAQTSGTYYHTYPNIYGCDSVVRINLIVNNTGPVSSSFVASGCNIYTLPWGATVTTSGAYSYTYTRPGKSDSIVTANITINLSKTSSFAASACDNYVLPWGTSVTSSGAYTHVYTSAAGCDSTVTANVTIIASTVSITTASACDSYLWIENSQTYTSSGSYTSISGCATSILNLTITTSTSNTTTASSCDSYTWSVNGQTYTSSGLYTSVSVCATSILNLTINNSVTTTLLATSCNSYTLPWGTVVTTSGVYSNVYQTVAGCDSTVTVDVTINYSTNTTETVVICSNVAPYSWNGGSYSTSGTYTHDYTNSDGCSSTATLVLTVNSVSSSQVSRTICLNQLPYTWNGVIFTAAGTQSATLSNTAGCDSVVTMTLAVSGGTPTAVIAVTQTLLANNCGARVYRYAVGAISNASGYAWTLPTSVGGVSGVTVDSGDITTSRVIRVIYASNNAAAISGDSIKVRAFSGCGTTATKGFKLSNTAWAPLAAPTITSTNLITNVCGVRKVRYSIPIPATTSGAVEFDWSFEGSFGGVIDSGAGSRIITVVYSNNGASTTADNVVFRYNYNDGCSFGTPVKKAIALAAIGRPVAPTVTNTVLNNNVCSGRKVRYSVPAYPVTAVGTTVAGTGYAWFFNGTGLHATDGTTYVVDSMDAAGLSASRVIVVRYISNAAQAVGDNVQCAYTTACGNGATSAVKAPGLTAALAQPAAPVVTNTVLNNNVCSGRRVRFSVPAVPTTWTTANVAQPTGYSWQIAATGSGLHASEGTTYVIDSGSLTSRVFVIRYLINTAQVASDLVNCAYTTACGTGTRSANKAPGLTSALGQPVAPTVTATILAETKLICGGRKVRYSVPAVPATWTTANIAQPTGYSWQIAAAGSGLHAAEGTTYVIDSGSLSSNVFVIRYLSNAAQASTDLVSCALTTACGTGARSANKAPGFTTAIALPAAPIVTATVVSGTATTCYGRKIRYSVPAFTTSSTTAQATGYSWSFVGTMHGTLGTTYAIDSADAGGLSASRVIVVKYLTNQASTTTDSVRCAYATVCGDGARGKIKVPVLAALTNCPPPTAKVSAPAVFGVNVYPNPSNGMFNVKLSGATSEVVNVRVLDVQGRYIKAVRAAGNGVITLGSDLKAGAYLLEVRQGNNVKVTRVLKY